MCMCLKVPNSFFVIKCLYSVLGVLIVSEDLTLKQLGITQKICPTTCWSAIISEAAHMYGNVVVRDVQKCNVFVLAAQTYIRFHTEVHRMDWLFSKMQFFRGKIQFSNAQRKVLAIGCFLFRLLVVLLTLPSRTNWYCFLVFVWIYYPKLWYQK